MSHIGASTPEVIAARTNKFFEIVCPAVEKLNIPLDVHWASTKPIEHMFENGIPSSICKNKNNNLQFMVRPGNITYYGKMFSVMSNIAHIADLPKGSAVG